MESTTYLKNIKLSPKKLRYYLASIKKMTPNDSLKYLYYGKQRANRIFYKAIQSAINNAVMSLKTTADLLDFKLLTIEEGQKLKRYIPGSRGNVKPIKRRNSHIKIVLTTKVLHKDKIASVKKENILKDNAKSKVDEIKPKLEIKKNKK